MKNVTDRIGIAFYGEEEVQLVNEFRKLVGKKGIKGTLLPIIEKFVSDRKEYDELINVAKKKEKPC